MHFTGLQLHKKNNQKIDSFEIRIKRTFLNNLNKKISNILNLSFFGLFYAINLDKIFFILTTNIKQVGGYFNNLLINKYTFQNLFIDNGFIRNE